MCLVHSTLRDATTPYTERWRALKKPRMTEINSNRQLKGNATAQADKQTQNCKRVCF